MVKNSPETLLKSSGKGGGKIVPKASQKRPGKGTHKDVQNGQPRHQVAAPSSAVRATPFRSRAPMEKLGSGAWGSSVGLGPAWRIEGVGRLAPQPGTTWIVARGGRRPSCPAPTCTRRRKTDFSLRAEFASGVGNRFVSLRANLGSSPHVESSSSRSPGSSSR